MIFDSKIKFAGLLAAGLLVQTSLVNAADWSQYRGSNHDALSAEKILTQWPADGLKAVWKTPTPAGFSSFTASQGKAFTIVQRSIDGSNQEVCIALEADSGKELWASPVGIAKYDGGGDSGTKENSGGDGPRSTPSVDGDRVYVLSAQQSLFCFEIASGKTIWSKDIQKEYGGKVIQWQSAASPLIEGDLVFVNSTAPGKCLMAFNKKDGTLGWAAEDDKMTHANPIAATILGTRQVIFFSQSGLVSVEPATGKVLWRYKFPYNVSTAASPVVCGDIVYCSAGYGVGAGAAKITKSGDTFTATELWRKPNKVISHWSTPLYFDGHLYGLISFKEFGKGALKCIDIATGNEVWSKDGFGPGGVIMAEGHLLVLNDQGELVLVKADPAAYSEVARFKAVDGKCWSTPALSNGRIYVRSTVQGGCFEIGAK
jgi:outer membrane protein assembly factor BamB